ncbi:peroxisomal biogenesis factor 11 [Blastocladiella britannica]|nr:peroxisomal biogenesis factor 11 [Blastocladiella britannica]
MSTTLPDPALASKYLKIADGRDKALKIVQYGFKVLLWAEIITKTSHPTAHPRISAVVSQFSLTRRVLRLGHVVEPYSELRDVVDAGWSGTVGKKGASPLDRLAAVLGWINPIASVVNDIVDDTICLAKIGAIDKSWSKKLDATSTNLWFATILIDLFENARGQRKLAADVARRRRDVAAFSGVASKSHAASSAVNYPSPATSPTPVAGPDATALARSTAVAALAAAKQKLWMQRVSFTKLVADMCFCWIDFRKHEGRGADGVQAVAGFCAALLATYKIYVKCL